jgi:hypothetical protein
MNDLLPCPFCGGKAYYQKHNGKSGIYEDREMVYCRDCYAQVLSGSAYKSPVANWNSRVNTGNVQKLKTERGVQKLKNERGAGRKPFIEREKQDVLLFYENENLSYRQIAELCSISVGSVHKLINEHKKAV